MVKYRLTGDPTYAAIARRVNRELWLRRHAETGLFGEFLTIVILWNFE